MPVGHDRGDEVYKLRREHIDKLLGERGTNMLFIQTSICPRGRRVRQRNTEELQKYGRRHQEI